MKKNILIIGGTGFLGFHLAKLLIKKKFNIYSVSRNRPKKIRTLKKVNYLFCDISNKKNIFKTLDRIKNINYVVNFGGEVEHRKLKKTFKSHFDGLKNISNFYKKKNIIKFIQIGSGLEYGDIKSPHKETYNTNPKSNYSKAKVYASKYLKKLYVKKKFPMLIIRPYQIYGPYQDLNRFIPIVINNCLKNKSFPCSLGTQYRDFLFVNDFSRSILYLLQKKNLTGHIFNIGTGRPHNIKNIINFIREKIKKGYPIFGKIKLRKDESLITFPSISKIKKYTNWTPETNLYNGLIKTINFYKKNTL